MKLIFFLVAFCLVSIRVYFSWSGKDRENRGVSESNMVIKSDNFNEEIKYSGKFQLTDDETGFKSISPGGYFKFRKNEENINAESNLKGEIEYRIYDGKNNLTMDEQGKRLVAEAIREMINWGFDASVRMERIYLKGGTSVLLSEVDSMKTDQVKILYLNRLFAIDSLSPENMALITRKIQSLGTDQDKTMFLNKISFSQLNNPQIASAYFTVTAGIGPDMDKVNALQHILDMDSLTDENAYKIIEMTGHLGSDMDKVNLFQKMIQKGLITGPLFDSLLEQASHMGPDMYKVNLYKSLIAEKNISENQWISLINKSAGLEPDMDKTNLLVEIAQKMPDNSPILKSTYQAAAKSIHNDADYGKALRAVE